MQKATRGGVIILDAADPPMDRPVSLARGGAWLGKWPVHRGPQSDLDGELVVRRTFDPNVPVQLKPGTDLQLGEYYPAGGSRPLLLIGFLSSDSAIVFHVEPENKAAGLDPRKASVSYTWTFGENPERNSSRRTPSSTALLDWPK